MVENDDKVQKRHIRDAYSNAMNDYNMGTFASEPETSLRFRNAFQN